MLGADGGVGCAPGAALERGVVILRQSPSLDTTPADLAGMALPTLVLAGSASHPSFRSVTHDLATVLPDARLVELYGSGHATYAERPDEFENAIRVFATKLDRRNTASA